MASETIANERANVTDDAIVDGNGALSAQDLRREQARETLLRAAWVVLARDGYEKITTRRIAGVAGVNVATLHYYFGTKEQLLSESARYALRAAESRLRQAIDGADCATQAFERVFAEIWSMVQEGPGIIRYDLVVRGFRDPSARADVTAIYDRYRELTEELILWRMREGGQIAEGYSTQALAQYVLCAVDGVLLQHVLTRDDGVARETLDFVRRHTLAVLSAADRTI